MNDFYLSELIAWIVNFKSDNKLFGYDHFFLKKKINIQHVYFTICKEKRKQIYFLFEVKKRNE